MVYIKTKILLFLLLVNCIFTLILFAYYNDMQKEIELMRIELNEEKAKVTKHNLQLKAHSEHFRECAFIRKCEVKYVDVHTKSKYQSIKTY